MSTLRARYLNALDIPEYLYTPKRVDTANTQLIQTRCLVVETQCSKSICEPGEVQDFLYKMLSAVGLAKKYVVCIKSKPDAVLQEISKYNAQTILLLDTKVSLVKDKVFSMQHPSNILKNEQLKREAWEVLKQVKVCLK
ncbi:hypothetical protein N9345_01535 [Candidatus Thioglobus sp.]|nr:hypothetical protein [Candidatus Thioglobus sp.]MDB3892852.1 hypothetical protein [Candidatus Thioglobus sp.]MDC0919803.1 hypothetical protein [Candidatus Thioglobus sp.]MDC0964795.1 hypothetical protein [Candidatus Thioglobus sp.]MDC1165899.1 hypothetical protein [Candidatus Thioglobus sp.]